MPSRKANFGFIAPRRANPSLWIRDLFSLSVPTPFQILVEVLGAGAGGGTSGGGGAGGLPGGANGVTLWVAPGDSVSVVVGAAGASGSYPTPGTRGGDSSFGSLVGVGGGASNRDQGTMYPGMGVGGSGAGVSATSINNSSVTFAAVSGQGNVGGGAAAGGSNFTGGGGGGAGGAGGGATDSTSGAGTGGASVTSVMDGASIAGGASGGYLVSVNGQTQASASTNAGRGGYRSAAPATVPPTAGAANSGCGGGGGGSAGNGAAGGSGRVIVRYPGPPRATGGTITQSGGYTYHTFNSSGTFTVVA